MPGTTVIFGDSGLGKTTNLAFAAKYLYEKTGGKRIRLITADGGGYKPLEPMVELGIVEPFSILSLPKPSIVGTINFLFQGYWPERLENGFMIGSKLIKPQDQKEWVNGEVGAYFIEGVTSISELMLASWRGEKKGMNASYSEVLTDVSGNKLTIGTNSQDHYGLIQNYMRSFIISLNSLPVERVILTGHENKGIDEGTNKTIRGVALVGVKGTDRFFKDVGECLHFESFPVNENVEEKEEVTGKVLNVIKIQRLQTRVFFTPHPDPYDPLVTYKGLKARVPAERVPELLKKYPGGYFTPTTEEGLDEFLRTEDELLKVGDKLRRWKEEIDERIRSRIPQLINEADIIPEQGGREEVEG